MNSVKRFVNQVPILSALVYAIHFMFNCKSIKNVFSQASSYRIISKFISKKDNSKNDNVPFTINFIVS